jgi:HEPN domain-containing protein
MPLASQRLTIVVGADFPRYNRGAMSNRARDWFNQSLHDLEQADDSRRAGRHEWACFAAQQSAEKAVKALHLHLGQEAWGHVVAKLLVELPDSTCAPGDLIERGRVLDNFDIPSRYPNSHPEGAPFEHYGPLQSEEAIRHASAIVEFVRSQVA